MKTPYFSHLLDSLGKTTFKSQLNYKQSEKKNFNFAFVFINIMISILFKN